MNDNFINEYFGIGIQNGKMQEILETFHHPRRCMYLLGAEDHGLSKAVMEKCHYIVKFKSEKSLNVTVAGRIVLYDRGINKP